MSAVAAQSASLALLNQGSSSLGAELRRALEALGAHIAYESTLSALDRAALTASGARVVVINLAPGEDVPDAVVDWLDAENYEIVINDSENSAKLEGFDLARFARHLAAKILHRPDIILPPRPPGAVAPPTTQQHWAERVPEADIPGAPPPTRLTTPPASPVPAPASFAPAPVPIAQTPAPVTTSQPAALDTAGGDSDSIDAQLAQALQSLNASAKTHTPIEEVPDLDALLASAPLEEEVSPPPVAATPAQAAAPAPVAAAPAPPAPAAANWSAAPNWSLEPVDEAEPAASASPAKQKSSEFGFETVSLEDSLAPHVDVGGKPDEHMQAAASWRKLETIPADVFLSPEVDPSAAKGATAIKPPVLSTLELVPFDDEVPDDPKADPKKK